jgi:hypothetical protein
MPKQGKSRQAPKPAPKRTATINPWRSAEELELPPVGPAPHPDSLYYGSERSRAVMKDASPVHPVVGGAALSGGSVSN